MATYTSTLRAVAAPRRAWPIAVVIAAVVGVELSYGGPRAALVPLGMSCTFVLLGPGTWRRFPLGVLAIEALAVIAVFGLAVPHLLQLGPTFLTDPGSLAIAGVLYCTGAWGLGRDIELDLDLEHVRLKAIRTHLDPHFLFNTLNAIAEWCAEDPKVAEQATLKLADMLRALLEGLEQTTWPLDRELALARDLLELHRLRDPDAFSFVIEGEASATVPPLVLVSLVENAVKHGPRAGHRGEIAIRVTSTPATVRCEVVNPGAFAPSSPGRGLTTLRRRLALQPHSRFSIAADGNITRAVLEIAR